MSSPHTAMRVTRSAVLLSFLTISACGNKRPSSCPIDGSPAQATRRLDEKSCEYTHFSIVERNAHKWVADCEK